MKPLNKKSASELLTRIDHGIDAEVKSLVMNNPTNFTIELSVQDKNRGYDWINIAFNVDAVCDANLLDEHKLSFLDLNDGISLVFEGDLYGFGVGSYKNISALQASSLYLVGHSMKFEERLFQ